MGNERTEKEEKGNRYLVGAHNNTRVLLYIKKAHAIRVLLFPLMMMATTTATSSSFLRPVTFLSSSFSKDGVVCRRKTYRCFDTIRDAKTKKKRNYDARVAASTSSSGGV